MGRRKRRKNPLLDALPMLDFDTFIERALHVGIGIAMEGLGRMANHNQPQIDIGANTKGDSVNPAVIHIARGVEYIPPRKASSRGRRRE
jgi:hypothetical protein